MNNCPHFCVQLNLYLDKELDEDEIEAIEAHLEQCRSCREAFNRERRFRESIQRINPLYAATEDLRNRIASMLEPDDENSPAEPRRNLMSWLYVGFAATVAMVMVSGILLATLPIGSASATLSEVAVQTHQRHATGRLPLELVSDSPGEVSNWFDGKVPFTLKLPNYQDNSGQDKLYRLIGARLVGFRNDYAAYVRYEMGEQPISLVVTSSDITEPEGGERITSRGLMVHYETISDLKVLTWTHLGLTYALVSSLEERGEQSCMVCHQDLNDLSIIDKMESLHDGAPYTASTERFIDDSRIAPATAVQ